MEGVASDVLFLTSINDLLKAQLLACCTAVVYTPPNEHFGIVPLEAMAASKPVVACNSGGPTESILDGATGFLCSPNPTSFAAAMTLLWADLSRAASMGQVARAHVEERFSRKVFGDRLQEILWNMCL
ncbi:unnamed protein product [Closterium sp. NIES-54]